MPSALSTCSWSLSHVTSSFLWSVFCSCISFPTGVDSFLCVMRLVTVASLSLSSAFAFYSVEFSGKLGYSTSVSLLYSSVFSVIAGVGANWVFFISVSMLFWFAFGVTSCLGCLYYSAAMSTSAFLMTCTILVQSVAGSRFSMYFNLLR